MVRKVQNGETQKGQADNVSSPLHKSELQEMEVGETSGRKRKGTIDIVPSGPLFTTPTFGGSNQDGKPKRKPPSGLVKFFFSLESFPDNCVETFLENLSTNLFLLKKENVSKDCVLKEGTYLCIMMHHESGDGRMWPPPLKKKKNDPQWEDDYKHALLISKSNPTWGIECRGDMSILRLDTKHLGNNIFNPTLLLNVEYLSDCCIENRIDWSDKNGGWRLIKEHEMGLSMHDPNSRARCQVLARIGIKDKCLRLTFALSLKPPSLFVGEERPNSRTNSFEEGGDDVSQPKHQAEPKGHALRLEGPRTRSRTKKDKEAYNKPSGPDKGASSPTESPD